jgi:hypothetical protein
MIKKVKTKNEANYYVRAAECKRQFAFYGKYYRRGGEDYRSYLVIAAKNGEMPETINLLDFEYDAVFVMMNPGSSKPESKADNGQGPWSETKIFVDLVKAKPDPTQYMLASLAIEKGWKRILVINLSDVREADSNKFVKKLKQLPVYHSVFSTSRNDDLRKLLEKSKDKRKVYVAWGLKQEKVFLELATMVKRRIEDMGFEPIGVEAEFNDVLYEHPLPKTWEKRRVWLRKMVDLIG